MSGFEDGIWTHLVEHHFADVVEFRVPPEANRIERPHAVLVSVGVLTAAIVATVLALASSTTPPQAYALTRVADGTYALSLHEISRGIPALNAKLSKLGIRETVVPIEAGCAASAFAPVQAGPGAMTQTVTVSNRYIPSGDRGFIAAEQLPDGQVRLAQGTTAQAIPSCFPPATGFGVPGPNQP